MLQGRPRRHGIRSDPKGVRPCDHAARRPGRHDQGQGDGLVELEAGEMTVTRSIVMNATARTALLAAVVSLAALGAPAAAQVKLTPGFTNPKITFWNRKDDGPYWTSTDDGKPMDASRAKVRDGMIKRRVLEEYAEFLS